VKLSKQILSKRAAVLASSVLILSVLCGPGRAEEAIVPQRPPAVPLVTHDPYFSIWSLSDKLTDANTKHWTGTEQPLTGLARIDGTTYRYMGARPQEGIPAMPQVALAVTPTHTVYTFAQAGVRLVLTFFTPALPYDLDVLSRPVTYLSWDVTPMDGNVHQVSIYLDADPVLAVDTPDQQVIWSRARVRSLMVLSAGSRDQRVLERSGDNLRIDWGYFHLAVPDDEQASLANSTEAMRSFIASGSLPGSDDLEMPQAPSRGRAARLAVVFPISVQASQTVSRHVLLAYTEGYAIEYLNRKLRPFWQRNGQTPQQMLEVAEAQFLQLEQRGKDFDTELTADLERAGGKPYAQLATLAYRQTLAAHGLAADMDGMPMLFPKENFSNGCISTVDVLYPSSPFFLFFNPALLEAQLKPVLEYAALPRWKWPFAPHDLGTYPLADGQVYGGGERTEEDQMPVEESGNMLILLAALGQKEGNWHLAEQYWPQLTKWAEYLRAKGLDPENQLSTDDFAGHLAHNANLSIKAIEGLAAYGEIARALGKTVANEYSGTAKQMATKWEQMASDGDHYKLAFDKPGTWSQKYNLVWDRLLGLNLFAPRVRQKELAFYLHHLNQYGLPLDNRADYTKLDWELWTATLADSPDQFNALMMPIAKWVKETPSRVPLTDWYDTKNGTQVGFQARSVVGGVYIKVLADERLAKKWRDRASH
jgi:Domain of unknown function (DUF4965)/Domain of unknown function (DUF1793)/Domain of unknown function (DUF5127)/Domain of unknown function (DUF4964)